MNTQQNTIETIVRLIIKKENKILLCKNKEFGHYFLPGGHVEFGDSLEKTIYKEMEEELALNQNDLSDIYFKKYLENTYGEHEKKHHEINFIFEAKIKEGIEIQSQENHIDFEWFLMEELDNVNLLPKNILTI